MQSKASVVDRDAVRLPQALAALKRKGCWLLVAGPATGRTHCRACRRLLGRAADVPRRRLLVDAGGGCCDLHERLPDDGGDAPAHLVDARGHTRSTAADPAAAGPGAAGDPSTTGTAGDAIPTTRVATDDLPSISAVVRERVRAFERTGDDQAPAEVRVCLDSLSALLAADDADAVGRFLDDLGDRVRAARGMGHVHLPCRPDEAPVDRLAPLFDAVIEVRSADCGVEHRWHLSGEDVTSDWLAL